MNRMLVVVLVLGLAACERRGPSGAAHPTRSVSITALNDTSPPPSPRDSVLASLNTDSGRCGYIEGPFNVPDAMEVIYGLYDRSVECSRWVCKVRELPSFSSKASREGVVHTRAAGQFEFAVGGQKKVLLLTETLNRDRGGWESCHACAPILGAALFAEIDGAWFVEAMKKDIAEIGAWGELPPRNLVQIGPETYGVSFEYGYSAQGSSIGGLMLMVILDGRIQVVADVHTNFSNEEMFLADEGAGIAYAYTSTISFQDGQNPEIRDMIVATTGSRPMDGLDGTGPIQRFQEQRVYVMKEDHYVLYDSTSLVN